MQKFLHKFRGIRRHSLPLNVESMKIFFVDPRCKWKLISSFGPLRWCESLGHSFLATLLKQKWDKELSSFKSSTWFFYFIPRIVLMPVSMLLYNGSITQKTLSIMKIKSKLQIPQIQLLPLDEGIIFLLTLNLTVSQLILWLLELSSGPKLDSSLA